MEIDRQSKGYDDKKIFECISCDDEVEATKFASATFALTQGNRKSNIGLR